MPWSTEAFTRAARRVKLLAMDVDGVLSDGGLLLFPGGVEGKRFHARDGHAMVMARRGGLKLALISGRRADVVDERARENGIDEVHQGIKEKWPVMQDILQRYELRSDEVAYMGDDVVDLPILLRVGLPLAPADAQLEVQEIAAWLSPSRGGHGAVAEAVRAILSAQGRWQNLMERYRVPLHEQNPVIQQEIKRNE